MRVRRGGRTYWGAVSAALLILSVTGRPGVSSEPVAGDFSLPDVTPLTDVQVAKLREMIHTTASAQALAEDLKERVIPLLDAEPHPLEVIHYEGFVHTDPKRLATVANLREMADVGELVKFWQVTGDPQVAATLKRFILAWSDTYEPTGNDVNENKFYPLLVAYQGVRSSFAEDEKNRVDGWVRQLGDLHERAVAESTHFTNRYSKHVRLLAICGLILDRPEWVNSAYDGVRRFVRESVDEQGETIDFKRRDTLTYHCSSLRPVIELARLAGDDGSGLYEWTSPDGGSIQKAVNFVVPYALGEKQHKEWVNTQVDLDRRRAKAGLEKYRPGRLFDPVDALELMEAASYFDPDLIPVVQHLSEASDRRYPTWQMLINAAAREGSDPVFEERERPSETTPE